MERLDERALRWPDWKGGRPIRLADGQEWLLPSIDFEWTANPFGPPGPWFGMTPVPDPGRSTAS